VDNGPRGCNIAAIVPLAPPGCRPRTAVLIAGDLLARLREIGLPGSFRSGTANRLRYKLFPMTGWVIRTACRIVRPFKACYAYLTFGGPRSIRRAPRTPRACSMKHPPPH
jgi:hypothetical protein